MNSTSFFEYLNSDKIVTNVADIDYSGSGCTSDQTVQSSEHIRGWIDIIGFEDTVKIDGIMYSDTSPVPILKYSVWGDGFGSGDTMDSITVTAVRESTVSDFTTAEIDIHLEWHHTSHHSSTTCDAEGHCTTITWTETDYYDDYATFSKSVESPMQYPIIEPSPIEVLCYNNSSLSPKLIINLPPVNNTIGYHIEFDNESIEYYHNVLTVEELTNGFPYGNLTTYNSNSIYEDSDTFSRIKNNIVINSSAVNESLKIFIITPYDEQQINYTVMNKSDVLKIEKMHVMSMFNIFVLSMFIVFLVKYFKR